jgi:hypothetical protein
MLNPEISLQRHNTENLKQNTQKNNAWPQSQFFIHSCVSKLFTYSITSIGLPFLLQENCGPILGIQGADNKLGQFLSPDIWATANHRNCLRHSLESCESLV